jgi:hypothetical protein
MRGQALLTHCQALSISKTLTVTGAMYVFLSGVNVFGLGVMLPAHSEVSPLVAVLCQVQLCTVSGNLASSYMVATAHTHIHSFDQHYNNSL